MKTEIIDRSVEMEEEKLPQEIKEYLVECSRQERSDAQLIGILHRLQGTYGYINREHMKEVSEIMGIPLAKIMGVVTFYHFFSLLPRGKHRISVCLGTACHVKGAKKIMERVEELLGIVEGETTEDRLFSIECARCIGACALAPVMVIDEKVYGNLKPVDIEGILESYGFRRRREDTSNEQS